MMGMSWSQETVRLDETAVGEAVSTVKFGRAHWEATEGRSFHAVPLSSGAELQTCTVLPQQAHMHAEHINDNAHTEQ